MKILVRNPSADCSFAQLFINLRRTEDSEGVFGFRKAANLPSVPVKYFKVEASRQWRWNVF